MTKDINDVLSAFSALMGVNGDRYAQEIFDTNSLSQSSYNAICENIKFNSKDSIMRYFGLVHYYYLQGIDKPKSEGIKRHNYQPGNGDGNYNGVDKNWAK